MAKRPEITPVSLGSASQAINENFNRIAETFDTVVSRDGTPPNQMVGDLDMNSNDLLNIKQAHVDSLYIAGKELIPTGVVLIEPFDLVAVYEDAKVNYVGGGV